MQQTVVLNPKPMDVQEHSYTFTQEGKPIIVIDSKGFNYKGELIDDVGEVYNLFKRYLEQSIPPIELPSDKEIEKEGEWLDNPIERINWKEGAKWMRNQILGQNK